MPDITIEIHLSPDSPPEVIQQILALASAPPKRKGTIHNATVAIKTGISLLPSADLHASALSSSDIKVRLIPVEPKTDKASSIGSLAVLLIVAASLAQFAQFTYNVSGTADYIIQFLEHYKSYFETKIDGSVVPIDQAKKTIKNAEASQTTPKNEGREQNANPSKIPSQGD